MNETNHLANHLAEVQCELAWRGPDRPSLGGDWHVRRFELLERIDEPFVLRLAVESGDTDVDVLGLVGRELTLTLVREPAVRRVHGTVLRSELVGTVEGRLQIALEVGPAAALAGLGARSRVFQHMSVPRIALAVLAAVLGPGRRIETRFRLEHAVRDYVVQWRESDLDFVLRILADAGIACLFEHGEDAETIVLVDDAAVLVGLAFEDEGAAAPTVVRFVGDRGALPGHESIAVLGPARSAAPLRSDVLGWDWKQIPPLLLENSDASATPSSAGPGWAASLLEDPGTRRLVELSRHAHLDETAAQAQRIGTHTRVAAGTAAGWGDVLAFTAGRTFELTGHPLPDHDAPYLITRVVHRGSFPRADERPSPNDGPRYFSEFACHPLALGYAPARRGRPRADGLHSAVVVGPAGEDVHTDEYGRIKVRFPWNRGAPDDDTVCCFLRCVQPWAGAGYGTMFLPRIGMEVMVAFVDGDPDRPICTGCVYNGWNPPPHALPEHKTRTVLRTSSIPGGDGYNELYFDDAAGHEAISLHAQRNLSERVRANHTTRVGVDQTLHVERDQTLEVGRNQTETIEGDVVRTIDGSRTERVEQDISIEVQGREAHSIAGPQYVFVGCNGGSAAATLHVQGSRKVVARSEIEHVCGGIGPTSQLTMVPSTVRIAVGTSSIVLLPGLIRIEAEAIVLKSKDAEMTLDDCVRVRAESQVVLARGPDVDAPNRLVLDGNAQLHGAAVTVSGDESLELTAAGEAGGRVTIDASEAITYHGVKTRIEELAGGFLEVAGGMVLANE